MAGNRRCLIALAIAVLAAGTARAAGRVELVLVAENQQGADFHQWSEATSKVGAAHVRLRGMEPSDEVGIKVEGTAEQPVYVVTGIITGRNELQLPGARFTRSDMGRLARWIADLAENGPPNQREAKSAFGLTPSQLEKVKADLGQPLDFATHGLGRGAAVKQIGRQLKLALQIDAESLKALDEDTVSEELSRLSCGTALACILRPAGMALAPQVAGRQLSYRVVPAKDRRDVWPIGWPSDRAANELLPALFEFHTVNIQGVSAAKAMEAIAQKAGAPLLLDHNALTRHGIEPEKVTVTLPSGKTTYGLALRHVLAKARLKNEVRVDEAGTPFIWVTTIKPM